ncbi:MAG: ABC transporter permease subunit [bacterium]|nr:ABC transporter permease subunit [bacterium]
MKKALRHPYILLGGGVAIALFCVALLAPVLAPYSPDEIDLDAFYQGPAWNHWFGTDNLGRDVLSRVAYGSRVSLGIGVTTRTFSLLIGLIVGCLSGYYGGKVDLVLQRLVDITLAFPFLLLVISIAVIFPQGVFAVFISLSLVMWAGAARLIRAQVMVVREREYVTAARAFGARDFWIVLRHIIPNSYAPALIWWTMGLGQAIMAEAGLSFLGVGSPEASWGGMINDGAQALRVAPWVSLFPGLALALTVLAFNLLGEGLRDVLDVREQ